VALKKIKLECSDEGVPSSTLREICVLKELSAHSGIVKLLEVLHGGKKKEKMYLVFEFFNSDL
jgi:cyclin-dependent kinase